MKSILFFVSSLDSGGLENYLLRFLTENHHRFKKVYVWCKSGKDGQLDDSYAALVGVELIKKELGYLDVTSYRKLQKFLAVKEIDVVCDFSGNFAGRVMKSAKKVGVKRRVAAYRGASDHFQKSVLKGLYNLWVRRLVYKNATNVISNSKAGLNYFYPSLWGNDRRFSVIYNGINPCKYTSETETLRAQLYIPQTSYVFGHTGRFNSAKNHAIILAVAEALVKKHQDIYFILCGNGVKKGLKEILISKGIDHKVLVFENRSDIPRFLNTMDCYFFPSLTEGQPNALIEAMIMGLPFVASDIPPIRETVGDNYPLYSATDVCALVAALEEKYLAREGRNSVQQKEMIERFEYKKRFDEFYTVLTEI